MKIFLSTLDYSGSLYLYELANRLKSKRKVEISGIVRKVPGFHNFDSAIFSDDISTVGLFEVFPKFPHVMRVILKSLKWILKNKPDKIVLCNSPDFNIPLAKIAKSISKAEIIYFIPPQVWAWRSSRIHSITKLSSKIIVALPFEEVLYSNSNANVFFVGHPLLEVLPLSKTQEDFRVGLDLPKEAKIIGLFPGSRLSEVEKIFPELLKVAEGISESIKNALFLVPTNYFALVNQFASNYSGKIDLRVFPSNKSWDVTGASDYCIIASGTASLEAGLFMKPSIVVYKMKKLTYLLAKLFVHTEKASLVNIILGDFVFPEFIQIINTAEIKSVIERFEKDEHLKSIIKYKLANLRNLLKGQGLGLSHAADIILS